MRRAVGLILNGTWSLAAAQATLTLTHAQRAAPAPGALLRTDQGETIQFDIRRPVLLAEGDGLKLDDDVHIAIRAAEEDCVLLRCQSALVLARVAWHLGRSQVPTVILSEGLLVPSGMAPVRQAILLGASAENRRAAFDPGGEGAPGGFDGG